MEILLIVFGPIVAIFGILLLFTPRVIIRMSEVFNQRLGENKKVFAANKVWGVLLILSGIYLFFHYYFTLI